jgi:hypothetical protein
LQLTKNYGHTDSDSEHSISEKDAKKLIDKAFEIRDAVTTCWLTNGPRWRDTHAESFKNHNSTVKKFKEKIDEAVYNFLYFNDETFEVIQDNHKLYEPKITSDSPTDKQKLMDTFIDHPMNQFMFDNLVWLISAVIDPKSDAKANRLGEFEIWFNNENKNTNFHSSYKRWKEKGPKQFDCFKEAVDKYLVH